MILMTTYLLDSRTLITRLHVNNNYLTFYRYRNDNAYIYSTYGLFSYYSEFKAIYSRRLKFLIHQRFAHMSFVFGQKNAAFAVYR